MTLQGGLIPLAKLVQTGFKIYFKGQSNPCNNFICMPSGKLRESKRRKFEINRERYECLKYEITKSMRIANWQFGQWIATCSLIKSPVICYVQKYHKFPFFSSPKALLHFHGSHHGSSRILIRGVPACDTTISSRCRCDIRSELGVYTGKYGVSTDRQGSNADHAGNAYGANTDFKEEHGGYWVLLRSLHGGVRCLLGYLRNVDG